MTDMVFIGDEVSAVGYRLGGIEVCIVNTDDALKKIRECTGRASVVLIASNVVDAISKNELDRLMTGLNAQVLIVPDIRGLSPVPDIAARIHHQLGMVE